MSKDLKVKASYAGLHILQGMDQAEEKTADDDWVDISVKELEKYESKAKNFHGNEKKIKAYILSEVSKLGAGKEFSIVVSTGNRYRTHETVVIKGKPGRGVVFDVYVVKEGDREDNRGWLDDDGELLVESPSIQEIIKGMKWSQKGGIVAPRNLRKIGSQSILIKKMFDIPGWG